MQDTGYLNNSEHHCRCVCTCISSVIDACF